MGNKTRERKKEERDFKVPVQTTSPHPSHLISQQQSTGIVTSPPHTYAVCSTSLPVPDRWAGLGGCHCSFERLVWGVVWSGWPSRPLVYRSAFGMWKRQTLTLHRKYSKLSFLFDFFFFWSICKE